MPVGRVSRPRRPKKDPSMTRRFSFAVALSAGLLTAAARGQEPTLFLGDGPNPATAKEVKNILLRPNTGAPFYAYVGNTSPNDRTVSARLLNAAGREISRVDAIAAPANGRVPVTFKGDDKPMALAGTQVRLQLLDEKNKETGRSDLDPVFDVPARYAKATAEFKGNRDTANELKVTVTTSTVADGPVKIKLDLTHVPGLIPESIKDGAFAAEVPASGGTAVLVARNL